MNSRVMITLTLDGRARTLSFDCEGRSHMQLGMDEGDAHVLVVAEAAGGDLLLRACGQSYFSFLGGDACNEASVLIEKGSSLMLDLCWRDKPQRASLFVRPYAATRSRRCCMVLREGFDVTIGSERSCGIWYRGLRMFKGRARLVYKNSRLLVQDIRSENMAYLGERALPPFQARTLSVGDCLRIMDLYFVMGRKCLFVWIPQGAEMTGEVREWLASEECFPWLELGDDEGLVVRERFSPAPWLSESIHTQSLALDPPPEPVQEEDDSVLMRIGPSFVMAVSSLYLGSSVVARMLGGESILTLLPTACMAIAMLGSMLVWPIVSDVHNRRASQRREHMRQQRYVAYLDETGSSLDQMAARQEVALRHQYVSVQTLLERASECSPLLMSHTCTGNDILCLRAGVSSAELHVDLNWPERHFSLENDPLWGRVDALRETLPILHDVPIRIDLVEHYFVGVVGEWPCLWEYARGLLVQLCALYSYTDLKIALVTSEEQLIEWEPFSFVPHAYKGSGEQRLVATSVEGVARLDTLIGRRDESAHIVVICASRDLYRRSRVLGKAMANRSYGGLSIVFLGQRLFDLPRDCALIVDLTPLPSRGASTEPQARMFERADVAHTTKNLTPDIGVSLASAWEFSLNMTRLRLEDDEAERAVMQSVGFLEMLRVGCVEHLEISRRWTQSDASRSLRTPIGIDSRGDVAFLDLHERADGPHGLIAGTTGSGKSELIIALILSLSVNYSPEEVAFLLIDYKGGGLAGAFINERLRLPHVVGSITNLDERSVGRALVSITSELRRRQEALNAARSLTGEPTMDINRYLSLRKLGVSLEPMPHLFIVADEFAELKQQEPAFMDELMSAARIGRSLGIHLLLATQKPTGVVNDQIWANARLKIALRVADAADSREMIRSEDAALLETPGSFCVLVGYDEQRWCGQAAYAGNPYVPQEQFKSREDTTVCLCDKEGQVIARADRMKPYDQQCEPELNAILKEMTLCAQERNIAAQSLWLPPLPSHIPLESLEQSHSMESLPAGTCFVGKLDDPLHQSSHDLTIDLRVQGNVALYGTTGSDVCGLLRVMVLSLARSCGNRGLWIYAIDAADGRLRVLEGLPCVGGVVEFDDGYRTYQLLRLLEREAKRRQALMAEDLSQEPLVVLAIANLPAALERWPQFEDTIQAVAHDMGTLGFRVIAGADDVGSLRTRMRSCFEVSLPTLLSDASDYLFLLGGQSVMPPPRQWRRGLALWGKDVLEFQGATFGAEPEEENRAIVEYVLSVRNEGNFRAPSVPDLPESVVCNHFVPFSKRDLLPVGMSCERIEPLCLDLSVTNAPLVVGNDLASLVSYVCGVVEVWVEVFSMQHWIVDFFGLLGGRVGDRVLKTADELLELVGNAEGNGVLLIMDAPRTFSSLSSAGRRKLTGLMTDSSEGGVWSFVLVCEDWRTRGLYDDWYRYAVAQGRGVWVSDGYQDQVVFPALRCSFPFAERAGEAAGVYIDGSRSEQVMLVRGRSNEE